MYGGRKWPLKVKIQNRKSVPKVKILNWKTISKVKTLNSNSLSANFISIIGNSKAIIDIEQLRIPSCENAVLNSQFPLLTTSLSPLPLLFFFAVCTGANISRSPPFFGNRESSTWRRDRPTRLPLFANVVFLPLEFGSHGKMTLTSLHDCYGSWHLYICRKRLQNTRPRLRDMERWLP